MIPQITSTHATFSSKFSTFLLCLQLVLIFHFPIDSQNAVIQIWPQRYCKIKRYCERYLVFPHPYPQETDRKDWASVQRVAFSYHTGWLSRFHFPTLISLKSQTLANICFINFLGVWSSYTLPYIFPERNYNNLSTLQKNVFYNPDNINHISHLMLHPEIDGASAEAILWGEIWATVGKTHFSANLK